MSDLILFEKLNDSALDNSDPRLALLKKLLLSADYSQVIDTTRRPYYLLNIRRLLEILYLLPEEVLPQNLSLSVPEIVFFQMVYEHARKLCSLNLNSMGFRSCNLTDEVLTELQCTSGKCKDFDPKFLAHFIDCAIEDEYAYLEMQPAAALES